MIKEAYDRLPDNYTGPGQVNIKALHDIVFGQIEELMTSICDTKAAKNLDTATGKTLDLIGANVMQPRPDGDDDEKYRLLIKVKIAASLSQGDIETINSVARALIGDSFISAEETWNKAKYGYEPAGLVFNMATGSVVVPNTIENVIAGGVNVSWILDMRNEDFKLRVAAALLTGEKMIVYPYATGDISSAGKIVTALSQPYTRESMTVFPE